MSAQKESKLGLPSMILLGINSIIGSGIFLLPGQVTALVGTWSLVVYGFVTLLVLAIAWCFSKCAALFNRDGGAYLYARHAFGDFIGFEIGMMRWAVGIIAWASLAVGLVTAVSAIWPEAIQEPTRTILILSLVSVLGILNMLNLGTMKFLNNIITVAKLIPLLFFVCIGVFFLKQHNLIFTVPHFETESFGAAILIIFYAFGGFEAVVVAAGEMRNPEKNLPIAVMSTIGVCSTLYFLIQLIALGTLGPALATSVSPISDVAELIFGAPGKLIIIIAMLISIGGVNIASSFLVPKNGVALASDGMIPSFIAQKNRFGTPYPAVLLTMLGTSFVALSGDFTQLVAISVISRFAQHISTCIAVYVFYKNKLTIVQKMIPIIALSGIFWLMLQTPLYQLAYGFAMLFLSIPLYFWWRRPAVRVPVQVQVSDS